MTDCYDPAPRLSSDYLIAALISDGHKARQNSSVSFETIPLV